MSEISRARHRINVPVISFITRRLIDGNKSEFSKIISQTLGVKINAKTNVRTNHQDDRAYVNITASDTAHLEAAKQIIEVLDQNAALIAKNHILNAKKDLQDRHFEMMRSHLKPLLEKTSKNLSLSAPQVQGEQKSAEGSASNIDTDHYKGAVQQTSDNADAANASKPVKKAKKILTIKFNDAAFAPRNLSQALTYLASKDPLNSYVFAAGPFGGGKTYTPLRAAFEGYNEGRFGEIILIRPAASTGRDPGAMPGNPRMKMDPYLKGGLGSNIEKMTMSTMKELEDKKIIRAFTPDFERGETYERAFILVDEPQNLTLEQADLLIGRLGEDSIMVFAGDIGGQQNDQPGKISGLAHLIATQGAATFHDTYLRDHTAYIKFIDGDSSARNKILPHVSAARNNPSPVYAGYLAAFNEASPHPARAKAVENIREYAVAQLEKASLHTLYRYEKQIQEAFPELYAENMLRFRTERPALKLA